MVIYNTLTSSQSNTRSEQSVEHCGEESRSPIATRTQPHTPTADRSHSYATDLLRRGVRVEIVQHLLGHVNISTTVDTYSHLGVEDARRALIAAGVLADPRPAESVS
jgi:site-specific recombinase XerD